MLYVIIYLIIYYALYIKSKRALGLFQVSNYNLDNDYLKWLRNNLGASFNHFDIYAGILTIISFYVGKKLSITLLVIAIILVIYDTENIKYCMMLKNMKEPIKYNGRLIRLIISYLILNLIPFIMGLIFYKYHIFWLAIGIIFLVCTYIVIYLANLIILPLEILLNFIKTHITIKNIKKLDQINFVGIIGHNGKTSFNHILGSIIHDHVYQASSKDALVKLINHGNLPDNSYVLVEINDLNSINLKINYTAIILINNITLKEVNYLKKLNIKGPIYTCIDTETQRHIKQTNIKSYGILNDAQIKLINYNYHNDELIFSYKINNKIYKTHTALLGYHNLYHLLASILFASDNHLKMSLINQEITLIKPIPHELEIVNMHGFIKIDDTYHSNMDSAMEAIDLIKKMPGKKVMVTPGFINISDHNILRFATSLKDNFDYIYLIGEYQTKKIYNNLIKLGFDKKKIFITNDINETVPMILKLDLKDKVYALYENDLPDTYRE